MTIRPWPPALTPQWQMFEIHGSANRDHAVEPLGVAIHLARATT
jgi:hypothetical protein